MRNRARIATLVVSSLVLAASGAGAQTISVPPGPGTFTCRNPGSPAFWCGQSFIAPLGANLLQSFTYSLRSPSSFVFELYAYASPSALGPALFTQALGPTAGDDFETLVFAPAGGIAVTGGSSYAAFVRIGQGGEVAWESSLEPYADGTSLACTTDEAPLSCFALDDYDLAFGATFASVPTVVPEPATLALTGGGLLLLGGLAHRRRRAPG